MSTPDFESGRLAVVALKATTEAIVEVFNVSDDDARQVALEGLRRKLVTVDIDGHVDGVRALIASLRPSWLTREDLASLTFQERIAAYNARRR